MICINIAQNNNSREEEKLVLNRQITLSKRQTQLITLQTQFVTVDLAKPPLTFICCELIDPRFARTNAPRRSLQAAIPFAHVKQKRQKRQPNPYFD